MLVTPLPLRKRTLKLPNEPGWTYARTLLQDLGVSVAPPQGEVEPVDSQALSQALWAQSGAMFLTGHRYGPPLSNPVPLAHCAHGTLLALRAISPQARLPDAGQLLSERAAIAGYSRCGDRSPGGSCHLLPTGDGMIAVNLPRADDWSMIPAWLDGEGADGWSTLATLLRTRKTNALLQTGRLLGLAVAPVSPEPATRSWCRVSLYGHGSGPQSRAPRVLDLSALWAGPLCAHLMGLLGAEVIKVESAGRPDGARLGPSVFYDLLNAGKASVALDLETTAGRESLRALLANADIVIESARPRGLRQMGLWAEELLTEYEGLTWISITGYGRDCDRGMRVAYGDDAAVAGGLSAALLDAHGSPVFCGDAIADPLTGMHAALAGWSSWLSGGGRLIDIALTEVARHCARQPSAGLAAVEYRGGEWHLHTEAEAIPVAKPQARHAPDHAAALGANTAAVLRRWVHRC